MAGGNNKKKKKPAGNQRGFATTSIASKPQVRVIDPAEAQPSADGSKPGSAPPNAAPQAGGSADSSAGTQAPNGSGPQQQKQELTPEEFEKQLEESELQLLVEKHAAKVRRDAQRQRNRLETDKRLLRGQAESLNTRKWLPPELMEQLLELIKGESRYAASGLASETSSGKMPSEEDLTIKLWTLQEALSGSGFPKDKVPALLQHILDIAPSISAPKGDSIWGLDEALAWFARECDNDELPNYEKSAKMNGKPLDTPFDTPLPSGATTPRLLEPDTKKKRKKDGKSRATSPRKVAVTCDEEIEPDELVPQYLDTRTKLYALQRPLLDAPKGKQKKLVVENGQSSSDELEIAKLQAKIAKIELDVLFEKDVATAQWREKKIILEREYSAAKKIKDEEAKAQAASQEPEPAVAQSAEDEIAREAEKMAAEILAENDNEEDALAGLFDSLPTNEVDPLTGKSSTVMTGADGVKLTIHDFGKWTGISPSRALDEICRGRDPGVKISYTAIPATAFAHQHLVHVLWSKAQEPFQLHDIPGVEVEMHPNQFVIKMKSIATPDSRQSEAYVATLAFFLVSGSSSKDEKAAMKLPPVWRDLWSELAGAKKSKADAADREILKELRALVRKKQDQELEDGVIIQGAFRGRGARAAATDSAENSDHDRNKAAAVGPEYYQRIWYDKSSSPRYQNMLRSRMQLPMWAFREQVLSAVDQHQVVIVCGETGCGKSTQVPSFLLEHQLAQGKACKIYCTEPRRISAISLARRVSEELGEGRNDLGTSRSLVGYSIRLEANTSRETRLVFATTGIVMRMLEGSNDLRDITHLVLDEVHERSIDSDFLLIVLKKLMTRRKDLKVVLMSATVDADRFSNYLDGAPVLNVPGRTFPVQVNFLEDAVELTGYTIDQKVPQERLVEIDEDAEVEPESSSKTELLKSLKGYSTRTRNTLAQMDEYKIDFDLIVQLISRIASDPNYQDYSKAILVFLPGIAEIRTLNDLLLGDRSFQQNWLVYPLHSTIATEEQEAAFLVPPHGMRKIVLATNIAETGITIPDVTCVIDTGKHREMRFDERRQMSRLIDTFISRANAKQRRGRAGRVQQGLCFHMFTKYRHDAIMADQQTPEMLRLSLQDLAIRVKICKIGGIEETLSKALDPPSAKNIRRAIDALIDVRALTQGEDLTPLGNQLARLPLDVFLGKLILLGSIFKCLDMAITVAAILSSKSPFVAPFGQRSQADTVRLGFRRGDSDILTVYNAYLSWKRVCLAATGNSSQEFQFCRKNFLSQQTLANIEDLKGQLLVSLVDSKFLSMTEDERKNLSRLRYASGGNRRRKQVFFEMPQRVDVNSENDLVSQAVLSWSFYPKLLVRDVAGGKGLRNVGNNQNISLHRSSVNRGHNEIRWMSYYHMMQSTKSALNAHETTAVEPFAIALLCGDVRCDMYSGVFVMDGNRARFAAPDWKTVLVVKTLRSRLRELLTRSFKNPGKLPTPQHQHWLEAWQQIYEQAAAKDAAKAAAAAAAGGS
ncbi:pre-mRNA-splicing factor ATP-dependent RNA helicase PRP43 [Pyricularia oryzae]|uniref:RNA helicase n=2 Tax=Pyricularia oryzae TaxID=318829 RepID=A0AA97NZS9_PYRO3|nr:pre-mRNA-splicing factor ATP-dependent RNA helicase PRP43 [Pyricularia oryzae Y34]KAI7929288.1 pre-mRNA-splicing factor ATP-dependent RNA helicase PRP43 [Pyricularia oryzae]